MRCMLLLCLALGCSVPPPEEPTGSTPAMDDAAARARVRAFFGAIDQRDGDALAGVVTSEFVLFENGNKMTRVNLTNRWQRGAKDSPSPRQRTCSDEEIRRGEGVVIYIGDCLEHQPAYGGRPAQEWQGWNTLVLAPEGGSWKVALWYWQKSGIEARRDYWNDIYRRGTGYSEEPNRLLVTSVEGVKPGRALDLAMGQGRNALYLAAQGWQVTGVDISDEGIRLAREAAAARGLLLDAVLADLDTYDFGTERWDLVTMIYAGADLGWIERIKPSVKPGGLFVLEFFEKDPDGPGTGSIVGVERGQLAPIFAGWEILRDEAVEDVADWGERPAKLIRFVARRR